MTHLHLVSTEPDRLAYEALQNIQRLHNFQQQTDSLKRMETRLTDDILRHEDIQAIRDNECTLVIRAGMTALSSGKSYDEALAVSLNVLEGKPWRAC